MDNLNITESALNSIKNAGGDHAQCTAVLSDIQELNAENGEMTLLRTLSDKASVTMKAFKDNKMGTVTLGSKEASDIEKAAKECVGLADAARSDKAYGMNESGEYQVFGQKKEISPDLESLTKYLDEYLETVASEFPTVNLRQTTIRHIGGYKTYQNTYGTRFDEYVSRYEFSSMFLSKEGNDISSFNTGRFSFKEFSKPFIEMGLLKEMLRASTRQTKTKPLGEKVVGTLVIAPQCLNTFLNHIIRAFMSGNSLVAGSSRWLNSIGKKVADNSFTLSSAPLDSNIVAGEKFTEDGFKANNQEIITEGILKSLLADLYTSNKTGIKRAESYGGSLVMEKGQKSIQEIISTIDNGILMYRFSGGNPQPSGDFSGIAKNSFIIKDGKIAYPCRETMVSGNLADMLLGVRGISKEIICDGYSVMPYAAFDGITIR